MVSNMDGVPNIHTTPRSEQADLHRARSREHAPLHSNAVTDASAAADRVELSEMGTFLSAIRDLPDIRVEKIAAVRAQVDAGTYETPEKVQATVTRLLDEIA